MVFSQEGTKIKTSACLQIEEKLYATEHSNWENFKTLKDDPEKTLTKTITAIQKKDDQSFKELSHPEFIAKDFETQKSAYFKQFEQIQISGIKGYLKFDNLINFIVQLKFKDKVFFSDFLFISDENENLGFIQDKKGSLNLQLA